MSTYGKSENSEVSDFLSEVDSVCSSKTIILYKKPKKYEKIEEIDKSFFRRSVVQDISNNKYYKITYVET